MARLVLHSIPHIEEVYRYKELLESVGVKIRWLHDDSLEITPGAKLSLSKSTKTSQHASDRLRLQEHSFITLIRSISPTPEAVKWANARLPAINTPWITWESTSLPRKTTM
jgi:hypothetical protein